MRIKQVLAFLGAAAVSTAVFAAPVSVSADGTTVTVHGDTSAILRLNSQQASDATGIFRLEDGRVLRLSSERNKVFMDVGGKREQLLPLSRTRFVAADSGARIALDEAVFPSQVQLVEMRSK